MQTLFPQVLELHHPPLPEPALAYATYAPQGTAKPVPFLTGQNHFLALPCLWQASRFALRLFLVPWRERLPVSARLPNPNSHGRNTPPVPNLPTRKASAGGDCQKPAPSVINFHSFKAWQKVNHHLGYNRIGVTYIFPYRCNLLGHQIKPDDPKCDDSIPPKLRLVTTERSRGRIDSAPSLPNDSVATTNEPTGKISRLRIGCLKF